MLLVAGEAGSGKTTAVERVVREACGDLPGLVGAVGVEHEDGADLEGVNFYVQALVAHTRESGKFNAGLSPRGWRDAVRRVSPV